MIMMILAHLIYFIVSTLSYDCTCKKYLGKFLKKKKKLEAFKQLKKGCHICYIPTFSVRHSIIL